MHETDLVEVDVPMGREPTDKQKRFVEQKLEGKSNYRAAIDAGYSENTAANATPNILDKHGTVSYMRQKMREAGITEEDLASKLREGLSATSLFGKDAVEHEDYRTRLEYLKYISDVLGYKPSDKLDITTKGKPINAILGGQSKDDVPTNNSDEQAIDPEETD